MNGNSVGSIHTRLLAKTNTKVYDVQYRVFDVQKGEKVAHMKRGFKRKRDAQQFLDDLTSSIREGNYVKPQTITVAEVASEWFKNKQPKWKPHTVNWYKVNVEKHIIPALGKLPIQDLTVPILQRFYDQKQADGYSATTVSYMHRTLRMISDYAIRKRYISENVTLDPDLNLPKKKATNVVLLSHAEVVEILMDKKLSWENPMAVPIALGGLMGLRRGEVLGLLWSDIDLEKKKMHIIAQHTRYDGEMERSELKTSSSERILPIPDLVLEILKFQRRRQQELAEQLGRELKELDNGFVCCYLNAEHFGKAYQPNYFNRVFSKTLGQLNLKHMRFHDLRHTYATNLIHLQIPLTTIAQLMGHSSPDITLKIYAHVIDSLNEVDFQKVNTAINRLAQTNEKIN